MLNSPPGSNSWSSYEPNQHLGPIERQHGIECAGRRVHGERGQGTVRPRPGSQDGVQVGAVVGVGMAHEDRIEREPVTDRERRGDPVSGVNEESESIGLDEVATTGATTTGAPATSPDHGEPHRGRIGECLWRPQPELLPGGALQLTKRYPVLYSSFACPRPTLPSSRSPEWSWPSRPAASSWPRPVRISRIFPRSSRFRT